MQKNVALIYLKPIGHMTSMRRWAWTLLRRIDVSTTSCACWESPPPPPPQYSKPSYAYVNWLVVRRLITVCTTVEHHWLEHLWDYVNMFETGVVRASEC